MSGGFERRPLPGARFGGVVRLAGAAEAGAPYAEALVAAAEAAPDALPAALAESTGLLHLPGLAAFADDPGLLLRLSRVFGPEVENYLETLTERNRVHGEVPEIMLVSNMPPCSRPPPPRPTPPLTAEGTLPVQFPHRRGWHTDQSYRRPPPDISLFLAVIPGPAGQGQTLFANGALAYDALAPDVKARIEGLEALHVMPGTGRSEEAVRRGDTPRPLLPHQRPQRQPLVRVHPVTGRSSLYLCESGQLDWLDGPIVGLAPGPDGEGAALVYALMTHMTQPDFTYVHEWSEGDLIVWDNRTLAHTATWFDAERHGRLMWRTTVHGNPGPAYAGEAKSWIARGAGEASRDGGAGAGRPD